MYIPNQLKIHGPYSPRGLRPARQAKTTYPAMEADATTSRSIKPTSSSATSPDEQHTLQFALVMMVCGIVIFGIVMYALRYTITAMVRSDRHCRSILCRCLNWGADSPVAASDDGSSQSANTRSRRPQGHANSAAERSAYRKSKFEATAPSLSFQEWKKTSSQAKSVNGSQLEVGLIVW